MDCPSDDVDPHGEDNEDECFPGDAVAGRGVELCDRSELMEVL